MAAVEFYFDYSCPWTCLAFTRLREAAMRTGSTIVWCPIRVDRVRHEINPEAAKSRQDPEPRKALYQAKDLNDWAIYCDLTIQIPDDWPPDTELALSGAVLANEAGLAAGYSEAIFRAYFAQRQDISQMETVCAIAESSRCERTKPNYCARAVLVRRRCSSVKRCSSAMTACPSSNMRWGRPVAEPSLCQGNMVSRQKKLHAVHSQTRINAYSCHRTR
jgi:2-hydroxychromene-2-carboxylate isomerase